MVEYEVVGTPDVDLDSIIHVKESAATGTGSQSIDLTGGEIIAGDSDKVYHLTGLLEGIAGGSDIAAYLKLNTSNGNYQQQQLIGAGNSSAVVARFNGHNNWYLGAIGNGKDGIIEFDITIRCLADRAIIKMDIGRFNFTDHYVDAVVSYGELNLASEITAISLELSNATASTKITSKLSTPT